MARRPRQDEPNAVHHVWARAVNRMFMFRDAADRHVYLDLLGSVVRAYHWDCLSYCLMGTHIHLVIRTRRKTLSAGMKYLHWYYAVNFNERHNRTGHLFEQRFGSSRLWTPEGLEYTRTYVDMNPVAAGLCPEPEAWPWGSAGARASNDRPKWLASRHRVAEVYDRLAANS